jgi:hypothetical protein
MRENGGEAELKIWGNKSGPRHTIPEDVGSLRDAEDRAWRIYSSHAEWISRVDAKAAVMLALEGVTLGTVIALTDSGRPFSGLNWWGARVSFAFAVALLFIAIVTSVWAIVPRVRSKHQSRKAMEDFIYFGHTRYWKPEALQEELCQPALEVLSRQLVVLAHVAWKKHYLVKWSVWTYLASGVIFAITALVINLGS